MADGEQVKSSFIIDFRDLVGQVAEIDRKSVKPLEHRLERLRQLSKELRSGSSTADVSAFTDRDSRKFGKRGLKYIAGDITTGLFDQFSQPNSGGVFDRFSPQGSGGSGGMAGVVKNVAQDVTNAIAFGGRVDPVTVTIGLFRALKKVQDDHQERLNAALKEIRETREQQAEAALDLRMKYAAVQRRMDEEFKKLKKRFEEETKELAYETFQYMR